jgi:cell filamentation protein
LTSITFVQSIVIFLGDVYAWAGTFRTVDISKGDSLFAIHRFIVPSLVATFDELKGERFLSGLAVERFCQRAAYYLSELNAVHPFREGNGRTQREFLRELALACDYRLDWTKTTKAEMAEASRESLRKGSRMLEPLIQRVTSRITNY